LKEIPEIEGIVKEIALFLKKSKEYGNFQANALQNMLNPVLRNAKSENFLSQTPWLFYFVLI
jgi:hypothetical protein